MIWKIIDFFTIEKIKSVFPEYSQGSYIDEKIELFSSLLWNELTNSGMMWESAIVNFKGSNSIPIMTIHKSKGLEYSSVYFVGLEDSAFWSFKNQQEEDRCAFFVALSRAKIAVTFTYSEYRYNMKFAKQKRTDINEFYSLLQKPGVANIIVAKEEQYM